MFHIASEKEELQQKIKIISMSTSGRETLLRSQLAEINSQLLALQVKKQHEHQKIKENKDKCVAEMEKLKESLHKLEQDYSVKSISSKNRYKMQNASNQAKLKTYQDTVADLERRLDQISEDKTSLTRKHESLAKMIDQHRNMISMTREELILRYYLRGESIAENEQAEESLESLREIALESFNSRELKDYFEGCKRIKAEQEEIIVKIRETQGKMDKIKKDSSETEKLLKDNEKNLENFYREILSEKDEQEIENLEHLIKETCENIGLEHLETVILSLNAFENFDIDEEILKIQLQKVESEEYSIKDTWAQESQILQETINSIPSEEQDLKQRYEQEYKRKCQSFFNKTAAITQWRSEVLSALSKSKPHSGPVKDRAVFLEFRNLSVSNIDNLQSQKSFENILTMYIEKLSTREKIIQENMKKLMKHKTGKENAVRKIKNESMSMRALEKFKLTEQLNLTNLMCKEKSLVLFIKNAEPELIAQVESLTKRIGYWSGKIETQSNIIENYLKPSFANASESLKAMLKESQHCKLIIKDLTEEENTLTMQLEQILEKQHSFMLNSLNETSMITEPDMSDIVESIEKVASEIEIANRKVMNLDNEYMSISGKLQEEENILNMKLLSLNAAMKNLSIEQKKLEDYEFRLQKIEENEAAPIPECMVDKTRAKSMNRFSIPSTETPEKSTSEVDSMASSHSRGFQKTGSSERSPATLKILKVVQDDMNPIEKNILDRLTPLLEGSELYKRFSQRSSLKQEEFDPLDYKKNPPEACGFGIRMFKLSKCLTRIDVKHCLRNGFDSAIQIDSILKVIVPQSTSAILKVQKRLGKGEIEFTEKSIKDGSYENMKERGYLDLKSKAFIERASACKWFPFSIALNQGGRIELIAKNYLIFKGWVNGVNCLLKNKKIVSKVKSRISSIYL